ncbi:MAG TPA: sulfurtransferase TusA family protein [Limnochordia bacterium]|nr:sulfurtransferase TusA family protein [Limnochordia bacterium]
MATTELDLRGEICPYPLTETKKKVEKMASGDTVTVWLDYPLAADNVPRWAEKSGHNVTVEKVGASEWKVVITKG